MITISTIGYEGAAIDDFVATLKAAGVAILLDVRAVPVSRRKGFSKNALMGALLEVDIAYAHLKSLGDPKDGREAARAGEYDLFRKIFMKHLKTAEACFGLKEAVDLVVSAPTCLLCYERDPSRCHRSLVADALIERIDAKIINLGVKQGIAGHEEYARPRKAVGSGQGASARWATAR